MELTLEVILTIALILVGFSIIKTTIGTVFKVLILLALASLIIVMLGL
jgi:hypothetical protein